MRVYKEPYKVGSKVIKLSQGITADRVGFNCSLSNSFPVCVIDSILTHDGSV